MPEYRITWEIQLDAPTPLDAARQALTIQRDPHSTAVVFTVREEDANGGAPADLDPKPDGITIDLDQYTR